jgi:predicted RNA-binding Zn ribbon-like protein
VPAPRHVELLVEFTNSVDIDLGTDDLATRAGLTRWLADREVVPRRTPASEADLALARTLRDGLREALVANHDGDGDARPLAEAAAELPLALTDVSGRPGLQPVDDGVRGALGQLLVAVNAAVADDTWRRMKICSADDCQWAYFDSTKNRSRNWCEWGCGNKAKTRSYRARRKAADADG